MSPFDTFQIPRVYPVTQSRTWTGWVAGSTNLSDIEQEHSDRFVVPGVYEYAGVPSDWPDGQSPRVVRITVEIL
jgi:hypothetical protein